MAEKCEFGFNVPLFAGGGGAFRDTPFYYELDWEKTKEACIKAERLGFDSLWASDHFFLGKKPDFFECWTFLSTIAGMTEKIDLGSLVLCNIFRHPSVLAKMGATLDCLSGGRLELGLGAGWHEEECRAYGIPWPSTPDRMAMLREAVLLIKEMWTQDNPSFSGRFYNIEGALCVPKPVQDPHPRIWIGGAGSRKTPPYRLPHAAQSYPSFEDDQIRRFY